MAARISQTRAMEIRRELARRWRADGWPTRVIARALGVTTTVARLYVKGVRPERERMSTRRWAWVRGNSAPTCVENLAQIQRSGCASETRRS